MKAFGKNVATTEFISTAVEKTLVGGMVMPIQKKSLTSLRVVYGNDSIVTGSVVYVKADQYTQLWAKTVYELSIGRKFILVPESEIVLIDPPPSNP